MNSSTQSFVLFSLGMILIIANAAQAEEAATVSLGVDLKKLAFCAELAIKNVCESVTPRATCMDLMRSNPKMQAAKSFVQLSKLVLKVAVKKATEGQKFLKELAAKSKNCPAIQECAGSNYDGVVRSFKSSLLSIKEDADSANYDAKAAADDVNMCESNLADAKIVNPAITHLNNDMKTMSAIAFAVTSHLE